MYATSHERMRQVINTEQGCIRVPPHQRRKTERDRAIRESVGIR